MGMMAAALGMGAAAVGMRAAAVGMGAAAEGRIFANVIVYACCALINISLYQYLQHYSNH